MIPTIEHVMAPEVTHVEKEKESLTEELIKRNDEIAKVKEIHIVLQQKIDSHVCTIVIPTNWEDPTNKLTRIMTEMNISENEMKTT